MTYQNKGCEHNTDTHKYCPNCKQALLREEYYKNKARHDNLDSICKVCSKKKRKERNATKEQKVKNNAQAKAWRENNKDKYLEMHKNYRERHADKIAKARKTPERREYNRLYRRKQRENPEFRLSCNVSRQIHQGLARQQGSKHGDSTFQHLPYTPERLREHLEEQFDDNMSWDNYGSYWHIDHIYPQSLLPYDSFQHPNFIKCWSLSNLQPLEAKENMRKSNKVLTENK